MKNTSAIKSEYYDTEGNGPIDHESDIKGIIPINNKEVETAENLIENARKDIKLVIGDIEIPLKLSYINILDDSFSIGLRREHFLFEMCRQEEISPDKFDKIVKENFKTTP